MKAFLLIPILALAGLLCAQTSILRGRVTDETGAIVPQANVVLKGSNGGVQNTTASENGGYSFLNLAPGDYTVEASAPDLSIGQPVKITLRGGVANLDLQLRIAATTQQVTVQDSAGPAVSMDNTANASAVVLKGDDLDSLADDPDNLQADLQALAGPSAGPNGGSMFVDGFSGGELPPKSSIREIRINQNPFSPEYDRLGFGRIEIFTKPGTDRWRGSLNYNIQRDPLNSRNPYSAEKAPLRLNEFEGGVSGALNRRTSLTLDAERQQVANGSIVNAVTLDPQTLAASPYNAVQTTPQLRVSATPRIDYQLTPKNTVTVRYGFTHIDIQDAGIGSFDLISRGYHYQTNNQTAQFTDTAVIGASVVNETRVQYFRTAAETLANSLSPAILVLGAFNGGGSQGGQGFNTQNSFELQNYTSLLHGAHSWKLGARLRGQVFDNISPQNFGGTFTFGGGLAPVLDANNQPVVDASGQPVMEQIQPIDRYRRTLLKLPGGVPTQFTISAGIAGLQVHQVDVGAFVGDDWKIRPNLTVNLGLRYETQTNVHDWRDWAPRIGLAWAPGGDAKAAKPKTVIRLGFGTFYDRFSLGNTLTAQRYNGIVQQQFVVTNPAFFTVIPPVSSLGQPTQVTQEVSSQLRAPYVIQSALTVERQLPANTTLAVTYTNSHGLHQLRSEDINAPLPGSGVFPLGTPNPLFLMTSSGLYNQNQLMVNVNARVTRDVSLYGFYVFNHAMSNTDGLVTFPANPYNFTGEYGPASTDIHHRENFGGSITTKWHIRFNPYVNILSGAPFDITTGSDLYGTTLFNSRPGIATSAGEPGVIATKYGLLDPNPIAGERLLPRNYGRGPGQVSVNLRVGKTWGFGPERGSTRTSASPGAAGPPPNNGGGITGGVSSTGRPYNLTISASARNLTNHTNPGPIIGNITSPLFGLANQSAGNAGGSGISENANNRRIEIQIRFAF